MSPKNVPQFEATKLGTFLLNLGNNQTFASLGLTVFGSLGGGGGFSFFGRLGFWDWRPLLAAELPGWSRARPELLGDA